jgi:hypothetical protein
MLASYQQYDHAFATFATFDALQHPKRFLAEGKRGTAGAGWVDTRLLADQFQIQPAPGAGTAVIMVF